MVSRETLLRNEYGHLELEILAEMPFLHLELHKWSPSLYKLYKKIFATLLKALKEKGFISVYVMIPDGDEKLEKFERMFGFEVVARNNGVVLMMRGLD